MPHTTAHKSTQRGVAITAIVIVIAMVNAALVHTIVAGAGDRSTTAWRAQTMRAFFAAESGIAIIRGELADDRIPESGTITLQPGVTVTIERSADDFPLDVTATARAGIATRRIEVRLE